MTSPGIKSEKNESENMDRADADDEMASAQASGYMTRDMTGDARYTLQTPSTVVHTVCT